MTTNIESLVTEQNERLLLNYRRKKWLRSGEFQQWLQQEELLTLTKDQAVELYRASGGRDTAQFKANTIEHLSLIHI